MDENSVIGFMVLHVEAPHIRLLVDGMKIKIPWAFGIFIQPLYLAKIKTVRFSNFNLFHINER